jgi:YbbR-like protein
VSLRAALTADWPLKLTSVGLSVLLWLFASSEEPASGLLQVELRVQPPPGRAVVRPLEPLRATAVGSRRELLRLSRDNLFFTRILPDTLTADSVRLEIDPSDVVLPGNANVRIQDLEPRQVTVELNPVTQRIVPVRPVVRIQSDSGFELVGGIAVVPGEVRLAGPRDQVAAIDSVRTIVLEIASADGPTEERVMVDTSDFGPVRVYPSRVTLNLNVQAISERTLWPVPVQVPSAMAASFKLDRDTVTVRVRGLRSRLAALTPDSIAVTVERAATSGALPPRAALRVLLPAGLTGKATPDSVSFRRTERG